MKSSRRMNPDLIDYSQPLKNGHGLTPLHLAALHDNTEMVVTLLAQGANPEVVDESR